MRQKNIEYSDDVEEDGQKIEYSNEVQEEEQGQDEVKE